ncbi:MAG: thioester oxidase [Candidatus Brocadia sp. UTAMX2]|jgi:SagB-type dehydrogenase family enzyme|nr:MAG: thioester oxidase [Candidatus Brocadia sp. UTAMX2]
MDEDLIEQYRYFLKDSIRKEIDFSQTDQNRGADGPPIEKPYRTDARRIDLVKPGAWKNITRIDLTTAIGHRESRRSYTKEPLTLEEISFLLWATQGVRGDVAGSHAYRTVPSAGCRHAFETYLVVLNGKGLDQGIYRYLPLSHQLLFEFSEERLARKIVDAVYRQPYPGNAPVTFIWTAIPYRMEWRYHLAAHKVIAIDAGHVCQNLYLACEAIGAGTCAIAAYDQEALDRLLRIDGKDEFVIYLSPVGKVRNLPEK